MDTLQQKLTGQGNRLEVKIENPETLTISYGPNTDRALYDICDLNGRILVMGEITDNTTLVEISDLYPDQYILLVLDGDKVCSTKFSLED